MTNQKETTNWEQMRDSSEAIRDKSVICQRQTRNQEQIRDKPQIWEKSETVHKITLPQQ